ncbi:transposase [Acidianus infernus]|uniref:Transposase n=1 Tax=Acidianus infernus TaxID=12915 RepID=A0A6A9QGQ4_ACIIN|nr:zinc ribbon domain-containing protein [Acidianus infernus]MUM64973.1 transposase [Acidianus infernus]
MGVNAQAVLQKNNEAWSSFFSLLKLKKEGKPPHMNRVSPPIYWKDREARKRKLILIAEVQSLADRTRNIGEGEAYLELLREKRRLFKKLTRRLLHLYRNLASHLIKTLYELGVSTIYLGYPFNIVKEKGNKFTLNMWSYHKLMESIEYGMKVYEVVEYNTSKYCAYHGVEVKRNPRGVVICPKGHKLHSDLNGALNILKKATRILVKVHVV